jgi:hypothetical protein
VAKWVGRCPECQAWGTVEELAAARPALARIRGAGPPRVPARPIGQVDIEVARARPTGVDELDRVLGGGIVPGAVVLLAGEPGVGKSTLLLEVAHRWGKVPAGRRSTSPARSPRARSGCAPNAPATCTTSSTLPRRASCPRCSGTSTRSVPAC